MGRANLLELPQDVLDSARVTIPELRTEIAVWLYAQGRLSVGKARELAGMSLWEFRHLLAGRKLPVHLAAEDLDDDLAALSALRP